MKNEGGEWVEELEKMKKVNFFPYLITDPVKGDMEAIEPKRENCSDGRCCDEGEFIIEIGGII